jgi:hypothetical protein
LGEAIDMLKDLEETLYFHAITEAMKGEGAYGDWASENKKMAIINMMIAECIMEVGILQ